MYPSPPSYQVCETEALTVAALLTVGAVVLEASNELHPEILIVTTSKKIISSNLVFIVSDLYFLRQVTFINRWTGFPAGDFLSHPFILFIEIEEIQINQKHKDALTLKPPFSLLAKIIGT